MQDIIVFGKGRYFKYKLKTITDNYNIIAFIDNAVRSDEIMPGPLGAEGAGVYSPLKLSTFPDDTPIILMSVKAFDMYMQLLQLGIKEERILFGQNLEPAYDSIEELLHKAGGRLSINNSKLLLRYREQSFGFSTEEEYKSCIRSIYQKEFDDIGKITALSLRPVSRRWGNEHGTPIDRYYIEGFLRKNREKICGDVLEIADNNYTLKFGTGAFKSHILHVNGWGGDNVIKGNLETGEGIKENSVDCLLCTQTIQFIYNAKAVAKNIYKLLRDGGCALITAHGVAELSMYDYQNWGEYWRFTKLSLFNLFSEYFDKDNIEINSYGNVKIATALLYGLAIEDMDESDFEYNDEQFPVIISVLLKKK